MLRHRETRGFGLGFFQQGCKITTIIKIQNALFSQSTSAGSSGWYLMVSFYIELWGSELSITMISVELVNCKVQSQNQ